MLPVPEPTVFIVDDDQDVREALRELVASVGLNAEVFGSAQAFLDGYDAERPGCLVLDIRMPGMSGLALQQELKQRRASLPIVMITAHGDVPTAVQAIKEGALEFLQKPFQNQDLIDKIQGALERDQTIRRVEAVRRDILARLARLTPREREVLEQLVKGGANKAIGKELGIGERTVETHRSSIMEKLGARSFAGLINTVLPFLNQGKLPRD
ncbi:MAG: response regulator transcription factor [Gammaproteobacteria bacterium]